MAKKLKTFQFNLINVLILYSIIGVLGVGSVEPIFKAVLLCFRGVGALCSLTLFIFTGSCIIKA